MPLAAITRLRLRGFRHLLPFAWHGWSSARHTERTPGFVAGALSGDLLRLTFWTVSVWQSEAAMRAFRASKAHQHVMSRLHDWCDEAAVAQREQADAAVPGPQQVFEHMRTAGRLLRLRHPSLNHAAGRVAADGHAPVYRVSLRAKKP